MIAHTKQIKFLGTAVLSSYSQVFFSSHKGLATILLLISFFDYTAGFCGFLSVLTSVLLVYSMGMDNYSIGKGLYGFNTLLVGLGIGLNFQPSMQLFTIVVFASLLTTFFTFALKGILGKYNLPYLSLPFVFGIWISLKATGSFDALGLSARGIYAQNEIYALGGLKLVHFYENLEAIFPFVITVYFKSLGAIFFQYNILAGIFISLGLLIFSRIMWSHSILGYLMALFFYEIFGADITQLSYSYIGFNYILSAMAIGGYFLVPNSYSYLASILALPMVVMLSFGLQQLLLPFYISIYSLPFNLLVILFLYALRFRTQRATKLREIIVQQDTPEKNLYLQSNYGSRMRASGILSISLPVMGEWFISQGHKGKYTHKGDWRHAFDFMISDHNGKEYTNQGHYVEDYYCYGKNIVAPADGYVVDLIDGIEDNIIGNMDLVHNWGNSIVIEHAYGLYSQMSHILAGSMLIKKGEYVKKGQVIAKVGNSGRSPYPHLHFQLQIAPYVGATTLDYPLSNYIINNGESSVYQAHGTPVFGQKISNVVSTPLIANAFRFNPSQEFTFKLDFPNKQMQEQSGLNTEYTFEVNSDIFKNTYFECKTTGAKAWFWSDGQVHHFSNYQGDKNSFLFYFMLALFKVELGYYQKLKISDTIPICFTFSGLKLFIQDFFAPFFLYLKSEYRLKFTYNDDDFDPQEIHFKAEILNKTGRKVKQQNQFEVAINKEGIKNVSIQYNALNFQAVCINRGQ